MVPPAWAGKMSERKTNAWWQTKEKALRKCNSALRETQSHSTGGLLTHTIANGSSPQVKIRHGRKRRHFESGSSQNVVFDPFKDKNYQVNVQFFLFGGGLCLCSDHSWPPALLFGEALLTLHVASWRRQTIPKVTFTDWLGFRVHWTEMVQQGAGAGDGLPDWPSAALIRSGPVA